MRKIIKRMIPLSLAVTLLLSQGSIVTATEIASEKEEVVYIMTDASGIVQNMNVVNIFGTGSITDYGDYSSVKMLTTNDTITQDGDQITFTTDADKVYYQGTLDSTEIPWNISIRYYMDDVEYTASESAGKSGNLEIRFVITKNENFSGSFYEDYALQATFTLDTNLCTNIVSDGATVANVGSDKQLAYTILPGKGIDTSITTTVTDFEMDAVTINGVKLNLNVEIDDTELMDKVNELMDAANEINDGASTLNDGATDLKTGGTTLLDGTNTLNDGAASLESGIAELQSGMKTMQSGLDTLNAKSGNLTSGSSEVLAALTTIQTKLSGVSISTQDLSNLTTASGGIKSSINSLYNASVDLQNAVGFAQYEAVMYQGGAGLDIGTLVIDNAALIESLTTEMGNITTRLEEIGEDASKQTEKEELEAAYANYYTAIKRLTESNAAIGGMESYLGGVSGSIGEYVNKMDELNQGYASFDSNINSLATKLGSLAVSMSELSSGISQLVTNYQSLDSGINEYTDGVASVVAGYQQLMDGMTQVATASKQLAEGSDDLSSGMSELYDGIIELSDGTEELSSGTGELEDKTSGMDNRVAN